MPARELAEWRILYKIERRELLAELAEQRANAALSKARSVPIKGGR